MAPAAPLAVLVTADVRAEPRHITYLSHHPALAPYVVQAGRVKSLRRLECVYLDTSSVRSNTELLSKQEAIAHFLRLTKRYPSDTRFFLNTWTWGYEELIKAVHIKFGTKVHLDSYKRRLYETEAVKRLDPVLAGLGTKAEGATRWHACERRLKCVDCWGDGKGCFEVGEDGEDKWMANKKDRTCAGQVVYVNPVEVGRTAWDQYKRGLEKTLARGGALPSYLVRERIILSTKASILTYVLLADGPHRTPLFPPRAPSARGPLPALDPLPPHHLALRHGVLLPTQPVPRPPTTTSSTAHRLRGPSLPPLRSAQAAKVGAGAVQFARYRADRGGVGRPGQGVGTECGGWGGGGGADEEVGGRGAEGAWEEGVG